MFRAGDNPYLPKFNNLGSKSLQKKKNCKKNSEKRVDSQKESVVITKTKKKIETTLRPALSTGTNLAQKKPRADLSQALF